MKRLHSVLTADLGHCIITGSSNVAIHHVFNGANRLYRSASPGLAQHDAVQRPYESRIRRESETPGTRVL